MATKTYAGPGGSVRGHATKGAHDEELVTATGLSDKIAQTPTITLVAYAAGDAIGGKLTFADAVGWTGGTGYLTDVVLIDDDGIAATIDLVLFDRDFTATADNAPFDPSDADLENCLGYVPVFLYSAFANNAVGIGDLVSPLEIESTGTAIYGQMVVREAATYVSTDALTVKIGVMKD